MEFFPTLGFLLLLSIIPKFTEENLHTKEDQEQLPVGYSVVVGGRPYAVNRDGLDCTLPFFFHLSNLTKFTEGKFTSKRGQACL